MDCGCGGNRPAAPRRPARNLVKPPSEGVLHAVTNNNKVKPEIQNLTEEHRKIQKARRDAILRALGRP